MLPKSLLLTGGAVGLLVVASLLLLPAGTGLATSNVPVREYTLVIEPADIPVGPNSTWHAWTFNGSVPGPVLRAKVGEVLRVKVINKLNLTHSFHTHLAPYELKYDGSQINTITGEGKGAMIPPGGEYVYEFRITTPGTFYYHCHSADGGLHIHQHIAQGLYGAIIVEEPDAPSVKDEVIFMAEIGHLAEGKNVPYFIINGKGIPGGEPTLEKIFADKGIAGVVEQFGKTVHAIKAKAGEPLRLHVINIGDQTHPFHLHGMNLKSEGLIPGRLWPGNVIQLVPGGVETVVVTPMENQKGVWLFHCHVVGHADAGMIGVMVVE